MQSPGQNATFECMTEDRLTTVAFTGHRTYGGQAATALRATVGELYARGFRTFLCGMAMGFDLAAAEAVLACRDSQTASALSPAAASAAAFPSAAASAAVPPASVLSPAAASAAAFPSVAASAAVPPASVFSPAAASAAAFPSVAASAAVPPASAFSPAVDSVSAFFPEPHSPHTPMPGLRLVAVIPFRGQESRFPAADRERFRRVLAAADHSVTLSPSYHAGCYAVRNNYLVEHAALLVAWYDGSPGGTHYTVRRALGRGLEFINLHPHPAALRQAEPTLF